MNKVTLDLLEEFPDPASLRKDEAPDSALAEEISLEEQEAQDSEETIETASAGQLWAFKKLLIIAAPIALAVVVISILVYYLTRQTPTVSTTLKPAVTSPAPAQTGPVKVGIADVVPGLPRMVYLKDFIIDVKDARGKSFVLMCDVVFAVGETVKPEAVKNDPGLRNIIYKTAQSRSALELRSVEEREKMKEDILLALEKTLGAGSVKNVYFLNYYIM